MTLLIVLLLYQVLGIDSVGMTVFAVVLWLFHVGFHGDRRG